MNDATRTFGPECAVLTALGTLYLYRLTANDVHAFREQPGTRLSIDKFRHLLPRIASTAVSDKGILDAGSVTPDQVESLPDEEVERVAEAYLDSTSVRWYRQEGASATIAVIRNSGEPATKFLDRLVNWYAATRAGRTTEVGAATLPPRPRPRPLAPNDAVVLSRREAWIALGALALLALLGLGAFLQHYLLVNALQRQVDALAQQVKRTDALLSDAASRSNTQNAEVIRRLEALEAAIHAQHRAARTAESAPPKAAAPAKASSKKSRRAAR